MTDGLKRPTYKGYQGDTLRLFCAGTCADLRPRMFYTMPRPCFSKTSFRALPPMANAMFTCAGLAH